MGGTGRNGEGSEQRCETLERNIAYHPLPSQRRFHESAARFKGFSGPIGSGKSQALCQEAIKLSYQNPGRSGLIGAPTYPMLRDTTAAALMEVLEQNKIAFEYNRAENQLVIRETRSKILFRAVEEFERLRGSNLAWFGLDELTYTSEQAWLRLEGRLRDPKASRLCGFAVWTPKGFDWVHERFIGRKVGGYETVIAAPFENRFILDRIPDYYDRLFTSYDARFYEQEALGAYVSRNAGRVYCAFDRTMHVADIGVNRGLPLLWALDFNWDPMSSVIAQMDRGKLMIIDEIVLSRATTRQACEEFARRYPRHAAGLAVYADASGAHAQTGAASDHSVLKEFLRRGEYGEVAFKIPLSNPPVRDRITLVNSKLTSADGTRAVVVSGRCPELIKDFEQVTYKENSQVMDKDRDPRRTHLSDAVGYMVWQEFSARRGSLEQDRRLI